MRFGGTGDTFLNIFSNINKNVIELIHCYFWVIIIHIFHPNLGNQMMRFIFAVVILFIPDQGLFILFLSVSK